MQSQHFLWVAKMTEQNIAEIELISEETAPAIYVAGGLDKFIGLVKTEVLGEVPDLSTAKGRARIASLAATVSKRKKAVENPGRDYLRHIKEIPKVVEAELRKFVTEMDKLRDEVRKPLDDWQAAEDARVDRHNESIDRIRNFENVDTLFALGIRHRIETLESIEIDERLEEFADEARQVRDKVLKSLRESLAKQEKYEAEQEELERLRKESEARAKADHEAAIAKQAEERARQEEQQKAEAERLESERRELRLKLQAEEAEKAKRQAELDRIEAEKRAEEEKAASARRAEEAAQRATEEERRRADEAASLILRQQQEREADEAHRRAINRSALDAFIAGGMTEESAKQAITLIAKRQIPNVQISY